MGNILHGLDGALSIRRAAKPVAAAPVEPASPVASAVHAFDPAEHTVTEVLAYLEQQPADADRVIALERDGKARKSIIG